MELQIRLEQLIKQIQKLSNSCYSNFKFKIGYLTFFSQDEKDYEYLVKELRNFGEENAANNGVMFILNQQFDLLEENIEVVRVRKPDIHRKELGCADLIYRDEEYSELRKIALDKGFDVILRKGYEMIELSTFDINVYAYLVKDL